MYNYFELTPREKEVYILILEGKDIKGIASDLVISNCTARVHVNHILQKKGASTRIELLSQRIKELEEEISELNRAKVTSIYSVVR